MKKISFVVGLTLAVCLTPLTVKGETVSGGAVVTPPAPIVTPAPVPVVTEPQINETLPAAVGLTCKAGTSLKSATVSWAPYNGAVSYVIYRKTGGGDYQWLKTMAGTSFTDANLKPGSTYTYKVQAKLLVAGEARQFELTPFSAESILKLKPAKVKKFKAKAHRGYISLSWKKGSKSIGGYEVWGKVHVKLKGVKLKYNKLKAIKGYKKTRLKHKMLVKGMTYSYKIRCYRKVSGKKIYSDYVTIKKKAK